MKAILFCLFGSLLMAAVISACQNNASTAEKTETAADVSTPATTGKGVVSITIAPDFPTSDYDKIATSLMESGEWTKDWTYHACAVMPPKGFFTVGFYPSQAALDHRRGIYKDLFPKLGVNAPAPQVYEVHNFIPGAGASTKPAAGFLVHFTVDGMSAEKYEAIIQALEAAGAGAPAGRMYHISYKTETGLNVVDVFDSEANFKAFGNTLVPILQANGVQAQPNLYPLYNVAMGS